MIDTKYRRLPGHLRRHGIAYAALIVAFSFSPVPSMAAGLVQTNDIANGAVTSPKIKNGGVTYQDLNKSARGAKVFRYNVGAFDFTAGGEVSYQLPGTWDAAKVRGSSWSVVMNATSNNLDYVVPGAGPFGSTQYRVVISDTGVLTIIRGGSGDAFDDIRVYRTVATSNQTLTAFKQALSKTRSAER